MTTINRYSPHGIKAIGSVLVGGAGDLEGGTTKGIMLNSTTTVDDEWDTYATLDLFSTFGEYAGAGYTRKTLANVVLSVVGTRVFIDFDPVIYTTLAATGTLEQFLVYVEKDGAGADPALTDRVPIALIEISVQPDGTQYTVAPPLGGFSFHETA